MTLPFGTRRVGSPTATRLLGACALGLAIVVVAAAVGVGATSLNGIPVSAALLAAPALVAFGFLVVQGPKWCLAGLIAVVVFGYAHDSISLGSVDLRVPDLFLVALAGWVVVLRARGGQRGWISGRRLLAAWLAALGFSLYPLLVHGTVDVGALVGWLRLVATFSLVWFVPYALYRVRDIEFVLGVVAFVATAEVVRALVVAAAHGNLGARLSGANDPNTTGLLAAIVVVLALHGPVRVRPSIKVFMFAIGIIGLVMSRSLGATAAAVLALGVYGVQAVSARRSRDSRQQLVVPTRLLAMVVIGLGAAIALRPSNLPSSPGFDKSTTVHRAVLADAGLELFKQQPLFGIGWQQSPSEIGSPKVTAALHKRFGKGINPEFIPEVSQTTEVHNSYIQVLAEAGLLGFLLLIAVLVALGRGIAGILRSVRSDHRLYIAARAAVVLLVVNLVWWNDNTLYGAQPESILAATFLGVLAATPAVALAARKDEVVEVDA